jgi:hypothetical protein
MAETLREQILAAAVARLKTIQTGNGYRTTLARVSELPEDLDTLNEFPVASLTEETEFDEDLYEEATFTGLVDARMHVKVTTFAKGSDAVGVRKLLNRLEADVAKALTTPDLRLGLEFVWPLERVGRDGAVWVGQDAGWRGWGSTTWAVPYSYSEGAE